MRYFHTVLFVISIYTAACNAQYYTAYLNSQTGKVYIQPGKDTQNGLAWGSFGANAFQQGWNVLSVTATNSSAVSDNMRAYGAGYLEGALSYSTIQDYWSNIWQLSLTQLYPMNSTRDAIYQFLETQQVWTQKMINANAKTSQYWSHVDSIQHQLQGILDGYNDHCEAGQEMTIAQLVFLNSFPDIMDIVNVVSAKDRVDWLNIPSKEAFTKWMAQSRCSSLVKMTDDDLFAGHTTWIFYSMLNKIYKFIEIPFQNSLIKSQQVAMSSYPGQISSTDDFYILDTGLVVMETSISVFNMSLYDSVIPQNLLCWQRILLANRMSTTQSDWVATFSEYNSGTYNNEWLLVNYNAYVAGKDSDVFWIVDQMPGIVLGEDQTSLLMSQGYFPSYNIPFIPEIYTLSGAAQMAQVHGSAYSYQACPRANIFRRNQTDVTSFEDMKFLMRYNNWQHDPLADGSPWGAIASRGDMDPTGPIPMGGTDSKVTSADKAMSMSAHAICGPTTVQQKPFSWSQFESSPHAGLPDTWDFPWINMLPF